MPLKFAFEATKFEESWSRQALDAFYEDGRIDEVLYRVKGVRKGPFIVARLAEGRNTI